MSFFRILIFPLLFLAAFLLPAEMSGQEQQDSLVRLDYGESAELLEINGQNIRKVIGKASFFHNNTYLLCDTAMWNIDTKIIDAIGNVSIIQDGTVLTSDRMVYRIDLNLAEFRGHIVQLEDSDHNTLRTRHLDYNTKDSVAVFENGGSMRDKDGQIIESDRGTYDAKIKTFTFNKDVNMFTDSIFVKTTSLIYESDLSLATFGRGTDAWQEDNMLSADAGWYDRGREIFFFRNNVHVMTDTQEGWSDSLYFYRNTMDVVMLGRAQVSDTTRNVSGLAGRIEYIDSLSRVTMTRKPAVISEVDDQGQLDTVYFGADSLIYRTIRKCDIDSSLFAAASQRLSYFEADPVGNYRKKAAEEAAKAAAEAAKNDPNRPPVKPKSNDQGDKSDAVKSGSAQVAGETSASAAGDQLSSGSAPVGQAPAVPAPLQTNAVSSDAVPSPLAAGPDSLAANSGSVPSLPDPLPDGPDSLATVPDSLSSGPDSLAVGADSTATALDSLTFGSDSTATPLDSLTVGSDSTATALDSLTAGTDSLAVADSAAVLQQDTTEIGFVTALRNVKVYRKNLQIVCDSLEYTDLDSLARLFKGPVIWNEITQQYVADSITAVIRNNAMEKAALMSNAFIHMQVEDTLYYNQVRSAEMLAFFDKDGELRRFDALGGAAGLFFLEENDAIATVNKKESTMLSATFVDGEIDKVYYYDAAKSDAYPVVQLAKADQILKGFNWQPKLRPADRTAVTPLNPRPPERAKYLSRPRAAYRQTDIYFPGYISDIYRQIAVRDSLDRIRAIEQRQAEAEAERLAEQNRLDSLATLDSLAVADSIALADSMAVVDSLSKALKKIQADSIARADSIKAAEEALAMTDKQLRKEQLKKERKEAKEKRLKEREARWADLDRKDADKAAAKKAKKEAVLRERKRKLLMRELEQQKRDAEVLEKYLKRIEARQARKEARRQKKTRPAPLESRDAGREISLGQTGK